MDKKQILRLLAASAAVTGVIALGSSLYNGILFEKSYETVSFIRETGSWHFFIGLPVCTFIWSVFMTLLYNLVRDRLKGGRIRKSLVYGLLLWGVYAFFGEIFLYLFYQIPFRLTLVGWLFHLLVFPVCGFLMEVILFSRKKNTEAP